MTKFVLHGYGGNPHALSGVVADKCGNVFRPQRVVFLFQLAALPLAVGFKVRRRRPGRREQRNVRVLSERGFQKRQGVLLVARGGKVFEIEVAVRDIRVRRQRKIAAGDAYSSVVIADAVLAEIRFDYLVTRFFRSVRPYVSRRLGERAAEALHGRALYAGIKTDSAALDVAGVKAATVGYGQYVKIFDVGHDSGFF